MHETPPRASQGLHAPRRIAEFRLPVEQEDDVLEHLAGSLLQAARSTPRQSGPDDVVTCDHAGMVWLDSGGPTLSKQSESILSAFAWKQIHWNDPRSPGLAETLASFAPGPHETTHPQNETDPHDTHDEYALPRFRGGWIGFLGYETIEAFEPVRLHARRDLPVPTASWGLYPVWYRLQTRTGRLQLWSRLPDDPENGPHGPRPRHAKWIEWAQGAVDVHSATGPGPHSSDESVSRIDPDGLLAKASRSFTKSGFQQAVAQVKEAVREGEVFQANLAHRLSVATQADPLSVYLALRRLNPSPFMGFFEEQWGALVSNSPERLFQVRREQNGRRLEVRPIAGTRPRGETPQEEARLRNALRTNSKERAEHTMLVDLARNDVGRVSIPGSVHVKAFQQVEAYSHVHHLVSRVEGTLKPDVGLGELVRALFPGGTITGAPKLRSIEVIDRVENVARGPYTGSLGYVNPDGTMDLNILIRTLIMTPGQAHAYAGAGIVAQSEPENEFEETLHKAAAMLLALAATTTPRPIDASPGHAEHTTTEDEESQWIHAARRGRAGSVVEGEV